MNVVSGRRFHQQMRFPLTMNKKLDMIRKVLLEEFGLVEGNLGAPPKQEDAVQSSISRKRVERIAKEIDHVLREPHQQAGKTQPR